MKAQMVKNAVIVPTGAKGGFVVKHSLPDPEANRAEVVRCYQTFIRSMLDLTDNLRGGVAVHPPDTVIHDADDTYLVVAADKGTATFSDVANAISAEYDFWLGDAFASGGSVGYDHKAMGITARGAWESVRRHARALGRDADVDPITAVGIGDMSGDVFGNGMLRSRAMRLVAAFDHRHIFIDPNPDAAAAFAERQRLFELARSSWADYDTALLSAGGAIYPRTQKSIELSPQARAALGVGAGALTADQLVERGAHRAGRPALERRHRHLRQGGDGDQRGRRGPRQRRRARQRLAAALPDGWRGRQPRLHPARSRRVRARRWADLHRRHRQLRRSRLQRPRGQHQDPPRRTRRRRRADGRAAQRVARIDDRRGGRAGARPQHRPDIGARDGAPAGRGDGERARSLHRRAGVGGVARPRPGVPAHRQADRRAPARRRWPDDT